MANHKSAEKRARQSLRRQARNSQSKSSVRTLERKVRTAVASNDPKSAQESLKTYESKAMKAAAKGVVSKKSVARKVGKLAARAHKLAQASA